LRIKQYFIINFILGISQVAFSQVQSTQGWFEVNYQQGCTPLEVSVKTTIPESDVPIFQFEGRDDPNQIPWLDIYDSLTFTYTNPGTYMIYLTVQNAVPVRSDSIQINVINSVLPDFELQNCSSNGVLVDILDTFYDTYIVDYGDGTIVTVPNPTPAPTHFYASSGSYAVTLTGRLNNAPNNCGISMKSFVATVNLIPPFISRIDIDTLSQINIHFNLPQTVNYQMEISQGNDQLFQFFTNLNPTDTLLIIPNFAPEQNDFCFRIGALNPCGGNRVDSNVVCNINVGLNLVNNSNIVSWTHVQTGQEMEIRISRNSIPNYITIPSGPNSFNDVQVMCETSYCYSVTIVYFDGSESQSPMVCGTSFSVDTPPLIPDMSVDVVLDGVKIDWEFDQQIDTVYLVQYSNSNDVLIRDTVVVNSRFISTDLDAYPQTCYTHSYKDVCTNTSDESPQVCSIYLTTKSNGDGSVTLNWTDFMGFQDSIASYSVQKYDQSGMLLETINVGRSTTYDDQITGQNDQIVRYVIEGLPANTTFMPIHSNSVEAARRVQLHFPTAFTPNNDGLNDEFKPEYLFIKVYDLKIYNRWGQLLFSTEDIETGWDGTFNGKKVAAESYTYLANAEDFQGIKVARSGIVSILKD